MRRNSSSVSPALHHLAFLHDDDVIGHIGDHGQIVGDQDQPHAVLIDQFFQQPEDLRLRRHVQRRRRLVGNQQFRPQGNRHGDDDALALAAGQVVRIAVERKLRLRQADTVQGFAGDAPCLAARFARVDARMVSAT